ncbi:MAG: serine hydrolase domain-containing protein, partial [Caulobacter sp.]
MARPPSPKALTALDQRLQEVMKTWRPAGLVVALVADDKVVFLKGYGVRSVGHAGAVDGDTLFQLASISKPLSSALIGSYVDEGRLSWSDRIVDRLPGFRVGDPLVTADLRLEDVLSHRSDVEATNWLIDVPDLTWRQSVDRLKTLPQQAPFRSRMIYDNFMYSVGGQTIVALGDDYGEAMRRRLFAPTGMTRSLADFESIVDPAGLAGCHECELPPGAPDAFASIRPGIANVATPHVRVKDADTTSIHWRHVASTAASSGMSSASDMARFVRMILNRGEIDGHRVLQARTVDQILARRSLLPSD